MKKLLKVLLYLGVGLAALLGIAGLIAKSEYHIERSITIDAPKAAIMDHVRYFKNFASWSPWQNLDPNMKTEISGPDGAVGATYTWSSTDENVGSGVQKITAITDNRIEMNVNFSDFGISPTFMNMEEKDQKTTVSWGMDMHTPFPWSIAGLFTDFDRYVGADYDKGLANLKRVVEEMVHKAYNGYEVKEEELPLKYYLGVRKTIPLNELGTFYAANLPPVFAAVTKSGAALAGQPAGLFWSYDTVAMRTDVAAAVPMQTETKPGAGMQVFPIGGKKALVVNYYGAYDQSAQAHTAIDLYMAEKGLIWMPPCMEEFVTDPMTEPDTAKWLTRVIYFAEPKK